MLLLRAATLSARRFVTSTPVAVPANDEATEAVLSVHFVRVPVPPPSFRSGANVTVAGELVKAAPVALVVVVIVWRRLLLARATDEGRRSCSVDGRGAVVEGLVLPSIAAPGESSFVSELVGGVMLRRLLDSDSRLEKPTKGVL